MEMIPETRGAKPKYNFEGFTLFETRSFEDTNTGNLLNSAKSYCRQRDLDWKFRCYTMNGLTHIVRVK